MAFTPSDFEYLMPDYYPNFSCKMGSCRTSCCEGWQVSVSEDDYFRLLGLECPPDIRTRLDCCLHVLNGATPDRYAEVSHNYLGTCQLHMADGRCMLHAALGESSLPLVCKLYPRAYRNEGDRECSCSGSCEKTVELLMHHPKPIKFIRGKADFNIPDEKEPTDFAETIPHEQDLRLFFISIIQDRSNPLYLRIYRLGKIMREIDRILASGEIPTVDSVLQISAETDFALTEEDLPTHLQAGLGIIKKMMVAIDKHGRTLNAYGQKILDWFGDGESAFQKYLSASASLDAKIPQWESTFENLLVNHMFFDRFPFADGKLAMQDGFLALGMIYTSMRFLAVGWMAFRDTEADFADVMSAAFRLFEHTPFHPYASHTLHREGIDMPEDMLLLMRL